MKKLKLFTCMLLCAGMVLSLTACTTNETEDNDVVNDAVVNDAVERDVVENDVVESDVVESNTTESDTVDNDTVVQESLPEVTDDAENSENAGRDAENSGCC